MYTCIHENVTTAFDPQQRTHTARGTHSSRGDAVQGVGAFVKDSGVMYSEGLEPPLVVT